MSLSLESLINTPSLYSSKISPDGKWIALVWGNLAPFTNIFIAPTDGSSLPIQITDSNQDSFIKSWTADGRSLVIGQDTDGNERVRFFRIDINNPKKLFALTEKNPLYFSRGGTIHPNNKYLFYGANFDFEKDKVIDQTIIYRHDLETGKRKPLTFPNKAGHGFPILNKKGTHILYERSDLDPSGRQVWLVDIDGKKDMEILNFGDNVKVTASWTSDGENIIFLSEEKTYRKVGILYLKNNEIEWLIDDPKRNIENVYMPERSDYVVIIEINNACIKSSFLNVETKKEIIWSGPENSFPIGLDDKKDWLCNYDNSQQPIDIILCPKKSLKEYKSITRVWEKVSYKKDDLVKTENFEWYAEDGLKIQGWLYRPKVKSIGTIVYVHGGPTAHYENQFEIDFQFFVLSGFNVFIPNYRGSTGFGLEFQDSIKKDGWGKKEQKDIILGIKFLIGKGIAVEGKIAITGVSYGGYSSWCAITNNPTSLIASAAPVAGMTDLVVDYNTTRPDLRNLSEEMMGGTPEQVPEIYYNASPINFIKNIKGKLLIIQGLQDPNVTIENVNVVEKELKRNNIPYELLIFEDEGHGILRVKNKKILLKKLVEFFMMSFFKI